MILFPPAPPSHPSTSSGFDFFFLSLLVKTGATWPTAPRGQGFQGFRGGMNRSSSLLPEPMGETNSAGSTHIPEKCLCNILAFCEHSNPRSCVLIEAFTHSNALYVPKICTYYTLVNGVNTPIGKHETVINTLFKLWKLQNRHTKIEVLKSLLFCNVSFLFFFLLFWQPEKNH